MVGLTALLCHVALPRPWGPGYLHSFPHWTLRISHQSPLSSLPRLSLLFLEPVPRELQALTRVSSASGEDSAPPTGARSGREARQELWQGNVRNPFSDVLSYSCFLSSCSPFIGQVRQSRRGPRWILDGLMNRPPATTTWNGAYTHSPPSCHREESRCYAVPSMSRGSPSCFVVLGVYFALSNVLPPLVAFGTGYPCGQRASLAPSALC